MAFSRQLAGSSSYEERYAYFSSMDLSTYEKREYIEPEAHANLEVAFCKDCAGIYTIRGTDFAFQPGDILILRNYEPHNITSVTKAGEFCNLNFDIRFLLTSNNAFNAKLLQILSRDRKDFCNLLNRNNPYLEKLQSIYLSMYQEFKLCEAEYETATKITLIQFFIELIRHFPEINIEEGGSLSSDQILSVLKAMDYIDAHFTERLSLEEISASANFSPSYFGTLFKRVNGITPWEYINTLRIRYATERLLKHRGTMLELAIDCGFANTANFNKTFKKYTGTVPKLYRQKNMHNKKEILL